jgi:hypothetical protein
LCGQPTPAQNTDWQRAVSWILTQIAADGECGTDLLTALFVETDWASRIDEMGRPVPAAEKEPQPDGVLVRAKTPRHTGAGWGTHRFLPGVN